MNEQTPNMDPIVQEPTAEKTPVLQETVVPTPDYEVPYAAAPVYEAPYAPAPEKKDNKKLILIIAAAVIAVLLVVLIVVLTSGSNGSGSSGSRFSFHNLEEDILAEYPDAYVTVGSDGSYMKLDTNPSDIDSDDFTDYDTFFDTNSVIEYANKELGFSEALWEKMQNTSSSMGVQTAESDGFTVSWNYRPDKGMEVMYEKK